MCSCTYYSSLVEFWIFSNALNRKDRRTLISSDNSLMICLVRQGMQSDLGSEGHQYLIYLRYAFVTGSCESCSR